tara:strand:+ start:11106 stop:11879 length:774 start_codon:yes stop_codon:yes gene_type:complete
MILRRLGNKKKLAQQIQTFFPEHKIYIEPFFGAGGMFFNKPKAKYNIVNDLDSDVFNLFQVVMDQKEELEKAFYLMPIHSDLLEYWKKHKETDPIKKALRFLLMSNFGYMGKPDSIHFIDRPNKKRFFNVINECFNFLNKKDIKFNNKNFDVFLNSIIPIKDKSKRKNIFIYSDPPYLQTDDNYENSFTKADSLELFEALEKTGCKWAMSEFNNPFILEQAKQRGLNVHFLGSRQNLKNRRTEILVTNYENRQIKLF